MTTLPTMSASTAPYRSEWAAKLTAGLGSTELVSQIVWEEPAAQAAIRKSMAHRLFERAQEHKNGITPIAWVIQPHDPKTCNPFNSFDRNGIPQGYVRVNAMAYAVQSEPTGTAEHGAVREAAERLAEQVSADARRWSQR
jgi:hypothetical protein